MNRLQQLINLIEEDKTWSDNIISSGESVIVRQPEHSSFMRIVNRSSDKKSLGSYDTRQPTETASYRKKYKLAK